MFCQPKVLLIHDDDERSSILARILNEHAILRIARNLFDLRRDLDPANCDAVFCGWSFDGGTWKDALRQVQRDSPYLPVTVFHHSGGEREWVEVLEAGAHDLLVPPYCKETVLPLLEDVVALHNTRIFDNFAPYLKYIAS